MERGGMVWRGRKEEEREALEIKACRLSICQFVTIGSVGEWVVGGPTARDQSSARESGRGWWCQGRREAKERVRGNIFPPLPPFLCQASSVSPSSYRHRHRTFLSPPLPVPFFPRLYSFPSFSSPRFFFLNLKGVGIFFLIQRVEFSLSLVTCLGRQGRREE